MLLNLGNNGKLQPCSTCVLSSFFIWKFVTNSVRIPAVSCDAQMFASFDGTSRQTVGNTDFTAAKAHGEQFLALALPK